VLSAVKPAMEGGACVLRCYNATAEATAGCWRLPFTAATALEVRADEREPRPLALEDGGRTVRFGAGPRAVVTVAVQPAPG
jgi:alpha-mannosidase